MLWLLAAEFRKLVRPLVWGTALAIATFCVLITWAAAHNARAGPLSVAHDPAVLKSSGCTSNALGPCLGAPESANWWHALARSTNRDVLRRIGMRRHAT